MTALLTTQEVPEVHPNLPLSQWYLRGSWRVKWISFYLGRFIITMENSTLKPIFHFLQAIPTPKLFPQALRNSAILECRVEMKRRAHSLPGGPGRQKQSILPAAITGVCFLWFQRHCAFQTHSLLPNEESGSCSIKTSATLCIQIVSSWK